MVRKRYKGISKLKRDAWVRQMAEDMPQLTQAEIGQRFGLDQSAVSRIMGKAITILPVIHPYTEEKVSLNN